MYQVLYIPHVPYPIATPGGYHLTHTHTHTHTHSFFLLLLAVVYSVSPSLALCLSLGDGDIRPSTSLATRR